MKRRHLVAVLLVLGLVLLAGIVLAGLGDTGSRAPEASLTLGHPSTGKPGVTVSVARIMARERAYERRTADRPFVIRQKPEPGEVSAEAASQAAAAPDVSEKPRPGESPQPKREAPAAPQQRIGQAATAPASSFSVGTSFLGAQVSESGFVPPDSMGSVGPDQVVVDVNGRIKVFDKQGNLGGLNVTDDQFWQSVRNSKGVTDPGVEYDRLTGRWIISAINLASNNNRVMIAVSDGSHITDQTSFTFFEFPQNFDGGDTNQFADYPQLGVDANAVYVGVNNFSGINGGFTHTNVFVINKADLLAASPTLTVTAFRNLTSGTSGPGPDSPQPATDMDPNVNEGYIVGPDNQFFSRIDVMRITDPGGTPSISGVMTVAVPSTSTPLSVPASGSSQNLDALDDRLFQAMIGRDANGDVSLWTAHNIRVNSSGVGSSTGDRDGARWYQIGDLATTPSLVQSGTLFDNAASGPRYFWIPSIAMNGQGHASLNTSVAGPGRFAEIASSGRLASDPSGTTEPFDLVQSSSSSYNIGQQGTILRWGDYSQTVVDPNDNMTFWTFQEYANATDSWAVRVIKLKPPPPAVPATANPNTVNTGLSSVLVNVTGTSKNGSGFFDPGPDTNGPGYANHIQGSVSGGVVVNNVNYVDPTHLTLDLDTTSATPGTQAITITNPDGQTSTCSNALVVGSGTPPSVTPAPQGTTPSSPANNNSPMVFGSNGLCGTSVQLYTNSSCSGSPVASGSALQFTSPGIAAPVADNSSNTFFAKATDISGSQSPCSASSVTYVEDSAAPQVSIDNGPSGATGDTTPTFAFHATDAFPPGDAITFKCSIDTGSASFGACSGPGTADTPGAPLAVGNYTFRVQATDSAGNSSVATRSFTVKNPPDTTITKGPKKKTTKRRPKFKFTSNEPGVSFQCSLDSGPFRPCAPPFKPPKLHLGKHKLKVRAVDSSGIADPTPAVRKFKVVP